MKSKDIFTFRDAEKQAGPVAFSTMLKPAGSACNLDCHYCCYLDKAVQYGGALSNKNRKIFGKSMAKFPFAATFCDGLASFWGKFRKSFGFYDSALGTPGVPQFGIGRTFVADEGYHRQIRKVTKNKGVFPSDTALEKLVYLAYCNIRKKWTMPLANWATISQQLAIKFGDRLKLL